MLAAPTDAAAQQLPSFGADQRRRLLRTAGGLLLFVLALRAWVQWIGPLPGERALASGPPWYRLTPPARPIEGLYEALGTPTIALPTVAAATAIVHRRVGPYAAGLVVAAACVTIVTAVLKLLTGPTPLWTQLHIGDSINYPSGHVAYVTAMGLVLGWLAARRGAPDVVAVLAVLVAGVGPGRLLGHHHLLSDVIAGYAMGAAWALAVLALASDPRVQTRLTRLRVGLRRRGAG